MLCKSQRFKGGKRKPRIKIGSITNNSGREVGNIILVDKTARFSYHPEAERYFQDLIEEYLRKGYEIISVMKLEKEYLH